MATHKDVLVPDLGNVAAAEIIEISVKPGDQVNKDDPLITLESDKASMEIPAPFAGTVESVKVKVGDKVAAGSLIVTLQTAETDAPAAKPANAEPVLQAQSETASANTKAVIKEVVVPDIGNASNVDVIEIHVKPGSTVAAEETLITLEGDKATMEIPAPFAGTVKELKLKVGDKVSAGSVILTMEAQEQGASTVAAQPVAAEKPVQTEIKASAPVVSAPVPVASASVTTSSAEVHAGPGVRRFARELGVDLLQVKGSGPKSRIVKEDVQAYVKQRLAVSQTTAASGAGFLPSAPVVDFAKFGPIETKPLNRIKKLTGSNLSRNWLLVPHVTQFEEADITELEAFRKAQQVIADKQGIKLTPLAFIMKAVVASLKAFPNFNASLDPTAENLIVKQYYHIGVAVDTPDGLVVPVIRDVDQKSVTQLAKELAEISAKARNKGLTAADMQGSTFTISSLGGIGGTAFTPIVNLPDVAILGISKSAIKPVYQDGQFVPRLMLPLSLSYDHRVIDGAEGARFIVHLAAGLADIRRLLL